jgi:hypothetical protein
MNDVDRLLDPGTIRQQAKKIAALSDSGKTNFSIDRSALPATADLVSAMCRENYPNLNIPFHSRWSHFNVGGIERQSNIESSLKGLDSVERARSLFDLVVVSVLLDAGAGMKWRYVEPSTQKTWSRSEGLAVASLDFAASGQLSSIKTQPLRVDATALDSLLFSDFSQAFQIRVDNPLSGDQGRFALLKNIGTALKNNPEFFAEPRLGSLIDYFLIKFPTKLIRARDVLTGLQRSLGSIWPGRIEIAGFNLGDVWAYQPLGAGIDSYVPFHKLVQWLTYSVIYPLEVAGFKVTGFEELSGLAEYRNGGLLVDSGVLKLREPLMADKQHLVDSELVIEWRALTLALLDELAPLVRNRLKKSEQELPLGKILEGGTWWAGRRLATQKRQDGGPPIRVQSDGTVF